MHTDPTSRMDVIDPSAAMKPLFESTGAFARFDLKVV
jgi:hypothetical protein